MLVDIFWRIATSDIALAAIGVALLVAMVVAHFPVIGWLPALAPYVLLAQLLSYVLLGLLALLIGFRVSDEWAVTQQLKTELQWREMQLEQQKATAEDADRLAKDAEAKAAALKTKVDDYEAALAKLPVGSCALDDTDLGRLRDIAR